MYCLKCNKHVIDCACHDIEERLNELQKNSVVSLAATSNLLDRKLLNNIKKGEL